MKHITAGALLLLATLTGCAHPINIDTPAPAGLAERFEAVAFYDEFTGDERTLLRWEGPIRAVVGDKNVERYRDDARGVLATLDAIAPMSVRHIDSIDEQANLLVFIGSWHDFTALREKFPILIYEPLQGHRFNCGATVHQGRGGDPNVIVFAMIFIDRSLAPVEIRRCLAQEITQALGLLNDIDDPDGTVFSSFSTRETLSRTDRQIVRILYDSRLRAGMTRAEAMPIVRRIIADLYPEQASR